MTDIITYQELRDVHSKELKNNSLQPLDEEFFKKVNMYIKQKHQMLLKIEDKKDNVFSGTSKRKVEKEIANISDTFKKLIQLRERKLSMLALMDVRLGMESSKNMTPLEVKLYKSLYQNFLDFEKKFKVDSKPETVFVDMLSDVPVFKMRGNLFGPFQKGEKVELPPYLAETLINGKKANVVSDEYEDTKEIQ